MMRIVIDGCCLGRRKTGNETYVRGLLSGIEQLGQECADSVQELQFTVLTTEYFQEDRSRFFEWVEIPLGNFFTRNFFTIPSQLKKLNADLYHATYWTCPWDRTPLVVTIHDVSFVKFSEGFRWFELPVYQNLIHGSAKRARQVLTVSEFSKNEMIDCWKLPEEKVINAPNGLPVPFRKELESAAFPSSEDYSSTYILYVGNLHPRKNLVRLLRAYSQLLSLNEVVVPPLKIVGQKAWLTDDIFKEVRASQLEKHIEFTGYVADEELIQLYKNATLAVYPSLYEGFGLPVLEAMACGCPVMTSKTTSLPEVAGDAAILVDPYSVEEIADGMKRLLGSAEERHRLSQLGRERAQNYNWRDTAEIIVKAYWQALN